MTENEIIKNDITQSLSLRKPQTESLEILARVLGDNIDEFTGKPLDERLAAVQKICPTVKDFDRDFPSLCFALATGVGKTRLMGAFISYLHEAHGIRNFMVIAPNLTIYEKLKADFTPGTPKYVFKGIAPFAQTPPIVITGETYQTGKGVVADDLFEDSVVINIFNIAKLTAKDKGHFDAKDEKAKVARIRRISETIGESYFNYLASRDDLVVLMDESHRYRAEAGATAINELKPILGIELTATPRVIKGQKEIPFRNIAYEYNLAAAMKDGFVKEPAIATRKGFNITEHVKDSPELEHLFLSLFAELAHTNDFSLTGPDENTLHIIGTLYSEGLQPMSEIAAKSGLDEEYITEHVKECYGRSASDILRERRMKYAAELLSDKKVNIYLVAEKCGYKNITTFSDDFKEYYGTSPEEYREQMI